MAVKSIIDIDVNSEAFDRFRATFERYQQALGKVNASWSASNSAAAANAKYFQDQTSALMAQNALLHQASQESGRFGTALTHAAGASHRIGTSFHRVSQTVRETTHSLSKWIAIAGAVGGLVGFGSLFGLDRLAGAASASRQQSLGLGLPYGELKAFQVNFERLVNPNQFLSGVNRGLSDITSPEAVGLRSLGISNQEIVSGNTGEVAIDTLRDLKALVDRTPTQLLGPTLQARRLTGLISPEEARRLKNTSPEEFNSLIAHYRQDQAAMAAQSGVLRRWQELSTQLGRAGQQITTVLINDLFRLSGPLQRLSGATVNAIDAFLQSPVVKSGIEAMADGLQRFASYIGTSDFQKQLSAFTANVGALASSAMAAAKSIASVAGDLVKWVADHGIAASAIGGAAAGAEVAGLPGAVVGGIAGATAAAVAAGNARAVVPHGPHAGEKPAIDPTTGKPEIDPITGKQLWVPDPGTMYVPLPSTKSISDWWQSHAPTWLGGLSPMNQPAMQKLQPVIDQLEKLGWSAPAAEGIAANVLRESNVRPDAVGDNGQALGLSQWHRDRQELFAKVFGHPLAGSSVAEQVKFIDYELRHGDRAAQVAGQKLRELQNSKDSDADKAAQAAAIISKYYERPAKTGAEMDARAKTAERIHYAERQRHVTKATQRQPTHVTIHNQTGGSAIVSIGAMSGV